jgi:hypothetical protein
MSTVLCHGLLLSLPPTRQLSKAVPGTSLHTEEAIAFLPSALDESLRARLNARRSKLGCCGECLNPAGRVIHRMHHFDAFNLQSAEETYDEYISESAYPYIIARCFFC